MKDNCMICGKHLSTPRARSEGVGPECKKGFSRRICVLNSALVTLEHINDLFDEADYDMVFWLDQVYWRTDEAPYTHSWGASLEIPSESAIQELLKMFGVQTTPDVPKDSYTDVLALQALHIVTVEPEWMSLFEGSASLETIRVGYEQDSLIQSLEGQVAEHFFPENYYDATQLVAEIDGPYHRLVRWAFEIGGREGLSAYIECWNNEFNYAQDWQIEEMEACTDAWERGDTYWGIYPSPFIPLETLVRRLPSGGYFSPLEAEEEILNIDWSPWEPPYGAALRTTPREVIKRLLARRG